MTELRKEKATVQGGSSSVVGVQAEATFESKQQANHTAAIAESTASNVLASKSTATDIQLAKVIALLRQGPKTTIELREHGIMMPAARIFQLKNEYKHDINSELVTLYDANGFRHSKCARYHLVAEASGRGA